MLAKATPDLSACADKRHSEQSRAGVTDECFGVAAVGFQHFERTMPGDIRDLDQVRAALHGASHEAVAEAVPTKCRRIEAELKRDGLDNRGHVARRPGAG